MYCINRRIVFVETRIVTVVNVFMNESTPESSACSRGLAATMPASVYKLWSWSAKKNCRMAPVAWLCGFLLIVMMMMAWYSMCAAYLTCINSIRDTRWTKNLDILSSCCYADHGMVLLLLIYWLVMLHGNFTPLWWTHQGKIEECLIVLNCHWSPVHTRMWQICIKPVQYCWYTDHCSDNCN